MKRRKFLQNITALSAAPFLINGLPFNTLGGSLPRLQYAMKGSDPFNENILVLVQLHGGNDGLNTLVPLEQYAQYYNIRPQLAIPDTGNRKLITLDGTLSDTLGSSKRLGLHPDAIGFKQLYDAGNLAIIQNVGYKNMSQSHFKGRDVWFGGILPDEAATYPKSIFGSGWMGRFLEDEYERKFNNNYPEDYPVSPQMLDPLGLEFSADVSLGFHTEDTIPAGISIPNPATFFDVVNALEGYKDIDIDPRGIPPITPTLPEDYRDQLQWILDLEADTKPYAERLKQVYNAGEALLKSGANYPQTYPFTAPARALRNPLSQPLEIIAKLINGGCKTKVYLLRIGGFDNHVNQVENYDNSLGLHAALIYHVSAALKAFQDDLRRRGIAGKVLTVTMSEFGRRARANGSYGSDHGTVAPMFVMGSAVNPGVIGRNANLSALMNGGDLSDKPEEGMIDFRVVFNTILQEWLGVSKDRIAKPDKTGIFPTLATNQDNADNAEKYLRPDIYDKIPLFADERLTALDSFMKRRFRLNSCYPNPVSTQANFSFYIDNAAQVTLGVYDLQGNLIKMLINAPKPAGEHSIDVDFTNLRTGVYVYRIQAGLLADTKKMIKI